MPRPVLIFDFDGTVALGDGPVLAYATAVAEGSGIDAAFAEDVAARLTAAAAVDDAVDGYDLVRVLAVAAGVDEAALSQAYLRSRALLGTAAAPVTAAAGLAEMLAEIDAERILVTNAPSVRLEDTLAGLGLDGAFDRIVTGAGKPAGLERLLDELGDERPVLSIGDIWRNDLAPAHLRGHATALVGSFADAEARPTFRATALEDLLDDVRRWTDAARVR